MHSKKKVRKENDQIKLMLDPGLLAKGFDINDLIGELGLELKSLGLSAGTLLVQKLLEAEVSELTGRRYGREEEKCYVWGKQEGYVVLGGREGAYRAQADPTRPQRERKRGRSGEL